MDVHLGLPDAAAARRELNALVPSLTDQEPTQAQNSGHRSGDIGQLGRAHPGAGQAVLATWHNLLDAGRMQDGEPNLAGTARAAIARMSAATAAEAGVEAGAMVTVGTSRGEITVPVEIATMPDRVVWLPSNSHRCAVRSQLGAGHGTLVTVRNAQ
jgi:NADH-quinone oxidoreductase subunit G